MMDSRASYAPLAVAGEYLRTAPVDLDGMAGSLGLTVDMDADLPPDMAGRIVPRNAPSGYHIDIGRTQSPLRRRFILAHEIAHFLLHKPVIGSGVEDSFEYTSRLDPSFEFQANVLATQIVMPNRLVQDLYKAGARAIPTLSGVFQVPEEAMRVRLRQLGLAR